MDNKAKSQVNSESIAVILTQLGAKRVVLTGLDYPELRLTTSRNLDHTLTTEMVVVIQWYILGNNA